VALDPNSDLATAPQVTASMTSGSSSAFMLADTAMSSDQTAAAAHLMTPSKSAGSLKRAPSLGGPHGSGSPVGSRGSRFDHMAALWPPEAGSSDGAMCSGHITLHRALQAAPAGSRHSLDSLHSPPASSWHSAAGVNVPDAEAQLETGCKVTVRWWTV